jgi:protein TonB
MAAVAAAIALHAVALLLRPGVSGGRIQASAPSFLAVRILHPPAAKPTASTQADPIPAPSAVPREESRESPAPKPSPRALAESEGLRKRDEAHPARNSPVGAGVAAAGASDALAAAPDYALGAQLDPGPRPLDEIDPEYPDTVRLRSGAVVLRLLISETGHVDEVGVVRAEPPGVFEQAAIEAFAKARFAPGMAGGRPVKSQIRIEVEFMPINRGAKTSGRSY